MGQKVGLARKLFILLGPKHVRSFGVVYIIMLIMAVVEVAGIAAVMPFMALVSSPETAMQNEWVARASQVLGIADHRSLVIWSGVALLLLVTAANAFAIFGIWVQFNFLRRIDYEMTVRLLRTYTTRPYEFFLARNSADLGKQVLAEVQQFINGFLVPVVDCFARTTVSLAIVTLLVLVNPAATLLFIALFGGIYASIFFAVRRRLDRLGADRSASLQVCFRTATELLSGIKAVKIHACEPYFLRRFAEGSRTYTTVRASVAAYSTSPRYVVETFVVIAIVSFVLWITVSGRNMLAVLPVLGLYAIAGYRLLPHIQKLYASLALLRFNFGLVDQIYRDMSDAVYDEVEWPVRGAVEPKRAESSMLRQQIKFEQVTFRYAGTDAEVLNGVDMTIPAGSSVAIVGETGCGKTTLVDILMGLLEPSTGRVMIDDVVLDRELAPSWKEIVGYVPQDVFLFDDSIARNIAFTPDEQELDLDRVARAATIARLHDFILTLPGGYSTPVGERGVRLSGGQRQRLGLARAIYREPDVLILDEATSALDGITEELVLNAIRDLPKVTTLVMIAHRLSTVKDCDQIYIVEEGRIAAYGTFEALIERNTRFRQLATLAHVT